MKLLFSRHFVSVALHFEYNYSMKHVCNESIFISEIGSLLGLKDWFDQKWKERKTHFCFWKYFSLLKEKSWRTKIWDEYVSVTVSLSFSWHVLGSVYYAQRLQCFKVPLALQESTSIESLSKQNSKLSIECRVLGFHFAHFSINSGHFLCRGWLLDFQLTINVMWLWCRQLFLSVFGTTNRLISRRTNTSITKYSPQKKNITEFRPLHSFFNRLGIISRV